MYLGIDIGSSSSKAVIINEKKELLSWHVENMGTGSTGPEKVVNTVLSMAGISREGILMTVATGYGRLTFEYADKEMTEISCHAKGVFWKNPKARTVIDVGGQDAKVIRINDKGLVENFVMNEKCAAGTGRFLEVMGRVLGKEVEDLSQLAEKGKAGVNISSTCTVFAESEMISQLASGASVADVALGAHNSIASRIVGLVGRIGATPMVTMTGGVALNKSVVKAIGKKLGIDVVVVDNPQIVGAVGAALFALETISK